MNEMKPEDVMRALEKCVNGECCNECPYFGKENCLTELHTDALAHLREKDAVLMRRDVILQEMDDDYRVLEELYQEKCDQVLKANEIFAEKGERINELELTLLGVMHSVDKWLDGEELEQDEVNRATTMREKTLRIVEDKDAEIERLKHSKGVAQVNIINEIANQMSLKEFHNNDIATGYSWAINDLLKLLLKLKKRVMGGKENDNK